MVGDIIIERLNLDGFLRGVPPIIQQGIFGLIFIALAKFLPLSWWFLGLTSFFLGLFFIADIVISKTVGWKKILGR